MSLSMGLKSEKYNLRGIGFWRKEGEQHFFEVSQFQDWTVYGTGSKQNGSAATFSSSHNLNIGNQYGKDEGEGALSFLFL